MVLGIVTVTYNSAGVLGEFFQSLQAQSCDEFQLYAVDNQSSDGSVEVLKRESRRDSRIKLIRNEENVGFAEGSNVGILRALSEGCSHVMLLNNDTVLAPEFLSHMREAGVRHPIVAPKIYYDRGAILWFAGGRISIPRGFTLVHIGQGECDRGQYDSPRRIAAASGCCMLIDASVFERIGLLDSQYFAYYEDLDFSLRARRAGIPIWYEPRAFLRHKVSSLTGGESSTFGARMAARNKIYYLRKNYGRTACLCFGLAYLVYLILKVIRGADTFARFRVRLMALAEGIRMRVPPRRGSVQEQSSKLSRAGEDRASMRS